MITITVTCIALNDSACMKAILRVLPKITTTKSDKWQPNVCMYVCVCVCMYVCMCVCMH